MVEIIALVSKGCGYCKKAVPILQKLKVEQGLDIKFVDASQHPLGKKISGVPTVLATCNGKVMGKIEGLRNEDEYKKLLLKANEACPTAQVSEVSAETQTKLDIEPIPLKQVKPDSVALKKKVKHKKVKHRKDPYDNWWGGK